ncbi:MAG: DNA mismatch repair endonuclease MutL [Spirochaetaceae bacterium]|jgi:DNA mismatch repair protein MutL|nr:DNA mismatch repair endonuclease MutL [Spirochaetaceae bacterium]
MGIIQFLPPEEARKIAAGEVIDRPASLVREFLDNALDSGAAHIETLITEGGTACVEVSDNGCGIARDDLEIACKTHATSKIRTLDDLNTARTLGFRGEALAAAAAVSRLEIITCSENGGAWRLTAGPVHDAIFIEPARRVTGTTVRALRIFETLPARKRFLKRAPHEAQLCRQIFTEKALAFPQRTFRFMQDGKLRTLFQAVSSYRERCAQALLKTQAEAAFLHEIHARGDGFSITIVVGGPEIYREHRREQFVFANGRRIIDFSFLQALEYGAQGAFPNGCHPAGAIFLDIDPQLADFNIHPAKREAKFADSGAIHHAISSSLRMFFHEILVARVKNHQGVDSAPSAVQPLMPDYEIQSAHRPLPHDRAPLPPPQAPPFVLTHKTEPASLRYLGSIFNFFLLVEQNERLFAIDQHAAHERILYDKLMAAPILRQELLVPVPFTTSSPEEDEFLISQRATLEKLGIVLKCEAGAWHIEALPVLWRAGDAETVQTILELKNAGENIAERWAATLVCHSALRDGDILDNEAALRLAEQALALPVQRCPHGRPFVVEIKKEDLLKAVRRV